MMNWFLAIKKLNRKLNKFLLKYYKITLVAYLIIATLCVFFMIFIAPRAKHRSCLIILLFLFYILLGYVNFLFILDKIRQHNKGEYSYLKFVFSLIYSVLYFSLLLSFLSFATYQLDSLNCFRIVREESLIEVIVDFFFLGLRSFTGLDLGTNIEITEFWGNVFFNMIKVSGYFYAIFVLTNYLSIGLNKLKK